MKDFSQILRGEMRRGQRIKNNTRVAWHVKGYPSLVGQGWVRNISTSGMLVELNTISDIPLQSIFSFDSNLIDTNYIPGLGQLVWRRKKGFLRHGQWCGIQFIDIPESILVCLRQKVEKGVRQGMKNLRISNMVGLGMSVVLALFIFYAAGLGTDIYRNLTQSNTRFATVSDQYAYLMREYQGLYTATTRRLVETTLELNQMTASYQQSQEALQATRQEVGVLQSILSQTELLLAEAKQQNVAMRKADAATATVALDQATNPPIQDVAQVRLLIAQYQDKIRALRLQLNQLRHQAYLVKIAHLRERDRARMALGNKGYFVREGQRVKVDTERYKISTSSTLLTSGSSQADSKIRVNVTVMQQ